MKLCQAAAAALIAMICGCTTAPATQGKHRPGSDPLALMEAVADWQLAHKEDAAIYGGPGGSLDPRGWVQGAFFVGLTDLAERSRQPRFAQAVIDHGTAQEWRLGKRLRHADDHVIGQDYLWSYRRLGKAAILAPMRATFDAILADPATISLDFEVESPEGGERPCQVRWCWSDALFMSPPIWARLSAAIGDPRYLNYADSEFWATTDYLYDREEHLYYRDSRFHTRRDTDGAKIFWSRGNGWAFAGIARILEVLPAGHPSRARYETLLREMAAKLITLQGDAGYWPVSLLSGNRHPLPETSGTGFFVYGLAWGVNHGILDAATYQDAINRGWDAMTRAVHTDGKLGWVQRIGYAPDQVAADDTQFYGVGAFLLAGGQVHDMRTRAAK